MTIQTTTEWERVSIPRGRRADSLSITLTNAGLSLGKTLRAFLQDKDVERIDLLVSKDKTRLALRPDNAMGAYSIKSNSIAQGKSSPLFGLRGHVSLTWDGDMLVGTIVPDPA